MQRLADDGHDEYCDQCARHKSHPRVSRSISHDALHQYGEDENRTEQSKANHKSENVARRKISFFEDSKIYHRGVGVEHSND